MAKQAEVRERILESAQQHFFQTGFSKVSMDELALDLGMSKKTVYKHFPGKELLLKTIARLVMKRTEKQVKAILNNKDLGFMEKLQNLMQFVALQLSVLSRPFVLDVQRNAPGLWKEMEKFRREKILGNFGKLFKEGVAKGMFRKDINEELLILLYISAIQGIINPEVLTNLPITPPEAFNSIITVFLEGVLTEKGKKDRRKS